MIRISLLVITIILISHAPDSAGSVLAYKDYIMALLLSLLVRPWLVNQYD